MTKRRIIVLIFIFLLLVTAGGFFWWQKNKETPPEKWNVAKVSPREDYVVKETAEGKIVENKKVGLSFRIPKDWILKDTPSFLPDVTFYSENAEINEERSTAYLDVLERGCRINVTASYIKTDIDTLEKTLEEKFSKWGLTENVDKYTTIEVSNYPAIRHTFSSGNLKMYYITVHLPSKNKLYLISLAAPFQNQDKEQCEREFDKFLETVSIR